MITKEQRIERKKYLGSSDIAALFTDNDGKSLDPFKTSMDVWVLKVFEQEPDKRETKPMARGHRYESALIAFAEQELGVLIETDSEKLRFIDNINNGKNGEPVFACNLDGYFWVDIEQEIVEAKTTGLTGEWGVPGTDDVPFRVNLQCQHQMLCTGFNRAHIAVLLGKWGLTEEMYVVDRNEAIIKAIIERGLQFWNDYVLTKTPPPATEPGNIEIFKRIIRQPETLAEVDSRLVYSWEIRKEERLDAEKAEKAAFAEVLKYLNDAEGVNLDDGRLFTYLQTKSTNLDGKMVKENYPDTYQACLKESFYRIPRIKKK